MANRYLSVSGVAKIDRSRRRIEELWNDYFKLWFPHGKESGDIAFVHVVPLQGEYWDSTGIMNTLSFVFESAKARLLDVPVEGACF